MKTASRSSATKVLTQISQEVRMFYDTQDARGVNLKLCLNLILSNLAKGNTCNESYDVLFRISESEFGDWKFGELKFGDLKFGEMEYGKMVRNR